MRKVKPGDERTQHRTNSIQTLELGEQIRYVRRLRGKKLQQVADAVGVSVGYLSQIERNRSKLTFDVFSKICRSLEVPPNWFFRVGDQTVSSRQIVRAGSRAKIAYPGTGITDELLSPDLAGPLELLLTTVQPDGDTAEYNHPAGFEAGYVIVGKVDLWIDGARYALDTGDSFAFDSTKTHRLRNAGETVAQILWVMTPAEL